MATKICTELLIMILNNVKSTQDLYSSLLVNRIWCKVTIPILWELLFGQEYYCKDDNDNKLRKKSLCIRTYISCMDDQARTSLTQIGFDLSSSPPQATFDYPSFTHRFICSNLVYFISMFPKQFIGPRKGDNDFVSRRLFREICKLIIGRCSFLDYFKLDEVPVKFSKNFFNYSDLIDPILELTGLFRELEMFPDERICPLNKSLALVRDNILNMDLELNLYSQAVLSIRLIFVQKRLENLSIVSSISTGAIPLLWDIISQKETLKSLRLKSLNFEGESPTGKFTSLQELYIKNCSGLSIANRFPLALSFTQLSSFHCFYSRRTTLYPQEFIMKIFEASNTNLKNIYLYLYPGITFDIFSAFLNYCTKITKLTLHKLSLEQVIAIFNNDFNELRRFSFDCGGRRFDANELLCQMAKNVPESLETIEIRMGTFSADSLRKFFEGWCCKGGENKKIIVKRTEQALEFNLSKEHFKVIKEYGVQFDMETGRFNS